MEKIIVGLVGVLLGVLLNEYFRRNARIEKYSEKVFEKRLEIYERFSKEISSAASLISNLVDSEDFNTEQKQELAFQAGLKVMEFTDEHSFYLNEEITVHCGMVFVEASNIFGDTIDAGKLKDFRKGIKDAQLMIRSESGLCEMDNFFSKLTKSTPGGKLIEGYRAIKKQYEKSEV
nr:hypothetical protein [uncultured Vibrio sp.]